MILGFESYVAGQLRQYTVNGFAKSFIVNSYAIWPALYTVGNNCVSYTGSSTYFSPIDLSCKDTSITQTDLFDVEGDASNTATFSAEQLTIFDLDQTQQIP